MPSSIRRLVFLELSLSLSIAFSESPGAFLVWPSQTSTRVRLEEYLLLCTPISRHTHHPLTLPIFSSIFLEYIVGNSFSNDFRRLVTLPRKPKSTRNVSSSIHDICNRSRTLHICYYPRRTTTQFSQRQCPDTLFKMKSSKTCDLKCAMHRHRRGGGGAK